MTKLMVASYKMDMDDYLYPQGEVALWELERLCRKVAEKEGAEYRSCALAPLDGIFYTPTMLVYGVQDGAQWTGRLVLDPSWEMK